MQTADAKPMTSNVKLLPLPEWPDEEGLTVHGHPFWKGSQLERYATDYARACVEHNVSRRAAEIEALRAEVDYWKGQHRIQAGEAHAAEARAERLAEALQAERRWWVDRKADAIREQVGGLTRGDPGAIARCDAAIQRIDAALHPTAAQEDEK